MKTNRGSGFEGPVTHFNILTDASGAKEAIFLGGDTRLSVVGFKPVAGHQITAATLTFADTQAGTEALPEIVTGTVTHGATNTGRVTVSLKGAEAVEIDVVAEDTADDVATAIRAGTFDGWTLTGATNEVIFTADENGAMAGSNTFVDIGNATAVQTSIQLQSSIDTPERIEAGTAIWKDVGSATASGSYLETVFSHPITAVRLDAKTPAVGSSVDVLVQE